MMVTKIINDLRHRGVERSRVEVKSAVEGCPKSLRETISAFANGSGGVIILGLDDETFTPTKLNPERIRDAVERMAADDIEPPVRGDIEIEVLEDGHRVVVFDIPEADPRDKPVYIKTRGTYAGSYIRSGEGDRRLTHYEIDRLIENRTQPLFDREPVGDASPDDLDSALVERLIQRVRERQPRVFSQLSQSDCLRKLGALTTVDGRVVPTLAGILTLGIYPQQFFPQLFISVVVLPTDTMGELGAFGERFIDNQSCDGPIPTMVADAVNTVIRNTRQTAVISEFGRVDRPEYPGEVIRELLVNAVMHRDYSPQSRGTQIQVEIYPNRLVVRSPGGIYGAVNPEDFGQPDVSSSRNVVLAKLLADTTTQDGRVIAENRGSGIPQIFYSLARQGIDKPQFQDNIRSLTVTVNGSQAERLSSPIVSDDGLTTNQALVVAQLRDDEPLALATIQEDTGLTYRSALNAINQLIALGLVTATAPKRSKNRKYLPSK